MRISNPPVPSELMATARSFGNYDLAAALADLIDNSIHAGASSVSVEFSPIDDDVIVRIRDDGRGMDRDALIRAMRPASSNPEEERDPSDLGRFGWGLKSASLSQARILTVISWQSGMFFAARWDIDDIADWGMDVFQGEDAQKLLEDAPRTHSGTEVVWSNSVRLFDPDIDGTIDEKLNDKISHAKDKLSLIFHRYLTGNESKEKINLSIQGDMLSPIDPFMTGHPSTQTLGEERIRLKNGREIAVQPYVLPHYSKLSIEEQRKIGGPEGMVRNQGFYLYRNKRLIIYGTWFRLVPHGELSQLTRVRVDLPNNLDEEWKITIDKSDAQLPVVLKERLRQVVARFNKRSVGVNRRKGVDLDSRKKTQPVWKRNIYSGRVRYLINRDHPIIEQLLFECGDSPNTYQALKLIESYFPAENIGKDISLGDDSKIAQSIADPSEFNPLIDQCVINYLTNNGPNAGVNDFLSMMKDVEPFSSHWKYTESYIREYAKNKWGL